MSKIDAAIESAKAQAEALPIPANDPAPVPTLVPVQATSPLTMEEVSAGAMTNDEWLKVKAFGLLIGMGSDLITDGILVEMNLKNNAACFGIKAGNPAIYKKTYDVKNAVGGGSWVDAIAEMQAIDPKAKPYRSADILMTVLEDNGDAKKGMVLGHSLSTSNFKDYHKFYDECRALNRLDEDLKVKVTHKRNVNKASNEWGTLEFELA